MCFFILVVENVLILVFIHFMNKLSYHLVYRSLVILKVKRDRKRGNMENLNEYIKPELLVLIPVLYFIGNALKGSEVKNNLIPFILGVCGIALSAIYVVSSSTFINLQNVATGIFTSLVQGILVAGASVYFNEMKKQVKE